MKRTTIQPEKLFSSTPFAFSQVVISSGEQVVHCAGQTANDKDLNVIGKGDFRAQLGAALNNVRIALEAAGATPENVTFGPGFQQLLDARSCVLRKVIDDLTRDFFSKCCQQNGNPFFLL